MIETVRCFVACDLTMELLSATGGLQRELGAAAAEAGLGIRWVNPATMHVTLKFLGDQVDKGVTVAIGDALRAAVRKLPPFDLTLGGVGAFPSPSKARVLWVGVQEESGSLQAAWRAVEDAMDELGFERERRELSPHVTLGRVKERGPGLDLSSLVAPVAERSLGGCTVYDLVLYRSVLGPKGAHYEPMVRARLEGQRPRPEVERPRPDEARDDDPGQDEAEDQETTAP